MNKRKTITWSRSLQKALRDARDAAIRERKMSFTVDLEAQGKHEFDVAYSGHVLQELDRLFATNPEQPRRPYNEGEEGQ